MMGRHPAWRCVDEKRGAPGDDQGDAQGRAARTLQVLEGVPGIDYKDESVTFVAKDFQAAYEGLIEPIGVATTNYSRVLVENLRSSPEGAKFLSEYNDQLVERWLDFESGRWTPPVPEPPPEGQRYHGAR